MGRAGDVIENPTSGETMVFLQTSRETGGELLQIDLFTRPGGAVGAPHRHPRQAERFIVKSGRMTLEAAGTERVLEEGDEATVPAGTAHEWWNSGGEELHVVLEFTPAGRFEEFIASYFALAKNGHLDARGRPGLLQSAVMLREYRDVIELLDVPVLPRIAQPVLNVIGRALGLRPAYPYPRRSRVNVGMEIWREAAA